MADKSGGIDSFSSSTREQSDNQVDDENLLTTGMEQLDNALGGGFMPGSLVTIHSSATSPADVVIGNIIANRPGKYYSMKRSEEDIQRTLEKIDNVNLDELVIKSNIELESPKETLIKALGNQELVGEPMSTVIGPINILEDENIERYRQFIRTYKGIIYENRGIGILLAVKGPDVNTHESRWITKYMSDYIIDISQQKKRQSIATKLTLSKVPLTHDVSSEDTKSFDISQDMNISIKSGRQINP